MHTNIHTYQHTYIHTNIHTYQHTYIHTYIHTYNKHIDTQNRYTQHRLCLALAITVSLGELAYSEWDIVLYMDTKFLIETEIFMEDVAPTQQRYVAYSMQEFQGIQDTLCNHNC
jgi:hypothetical protein